MLTRDDLKAIAKLIIESEHRTGERISSVEQNVSSLNRVLIKKMTAMEKRIVNRMIKSQNIIIGDFEEERIRVRQRLGKVEDKLGMAAVN